MHHGQCKILIQIFCACLFDDEARSYQQQTDYHVLKKYTRFLSGQYTSPWKHTILIPGKKLMFWKAQYGPLPLFKKGVNFICLPWTGKTSEL